MRKITEMHNGSFSAKIYRDTEYNEYRVRFYHANSLLPECDAFETDEESARGTAEMGLKMMRDQRIIDELDRLAEQEDYEFASLEW